MLQPYEIQELAALGRVRELNHALDQLLSGGRPITAPYLKAVQELVTHGHPREVREITNKFDTLVARLDATHSVSDEVRYEQGYMYLVTGRPRKALTIARASALVRLIALAAAVLGDRATADSAVDALLAQSPRVANCATSARVAAMFGDRPRAREMLRRTLMFPKATELLHYPPGLDSLQTYPPVEAIIRNSNAGV